MGFPFGFFRGFLCVLLRILKDLHPEGFRGGGAKKRTHYILAQNQKNCPRILI